MLMVVGMMLTTELGRNVWEFVLESKQEVRKVVWPTREETMRTTLLVFAMVFIVGLDSVVAGYVPFLGCASFDWSGWVRDGSSLVCCSRLLKL